MKKINVIDLDGTLIPYDSLRKYVFHFLTRPSTFFSISFIIVMRLIRIYNSKVFLQKILIAGRKSKNYEGFIERLAKQIVEEIIPSRMELIKAQTEEGTLCVLCSASPIDYVQLVGEHLGWEVVASDLTDSGVNHLYGEQKLKTIEKLYPKLSYEYNFAMGDSQSDLYLMKEFKVYELIQA